MCYHLGYLTPHRPFDPIAQSSNAPQTKSLRSAVTESDDRVPADLEKHGSVCPQIA